MRITTNLKRSLGGAAGFTIAEAIVSTAVVMIGMAAVMVLNSAHLRFVKSTRQSNAATLALQERVEQMRLGNWRNMTNATFLRDNVLTTAPKSAAPLDRFSEKITVTAYPDESAAQKLIVTRYADGTRSTLVSGAGLTTQRLAKIELEANWIGADGRLRTRAIDTVLSNGGISKMNLPGFGSAAGSTTTTTTTTPTGGSGGSGGSATPAPTATTVPGNGRGNVGGAPGKG